MYSARRASGKSAQTGLPFRQRERNGVQKQVFEAVYRVALRLVDVAHIHDDHLRLLPLERQLQRPRRRLQRFSRVRQIVTGYPRPVVQLGGIHRVHDVARPQKEDVDGLLFAVKRAVLLFAVLAEHDAVQRQQGQRQRQRKQTESLFHSLPPASELEIDKRLRVVIRSPYAENHHQQHAQQHQRHAQGGRAAIQPRGQRASGARAAASSAPSAARPTTSTSAAET